MTDQELLEVKFREEVLDTLKLKQHFIREISFINIEGSHEKSLEVGLDS